MRSSCKLIAHVKKIDGISSKRNACGETGKNTQFLDLPHNGCSRNDIQFLNWMLRMLVQFLTLVLNDTARYKFAWELRK